MSNQTWIPMGWGQMNFILRHPQTKFKKLHQLIILMKNWVWNFCVHFVKLNVVTALNGALAYTDNTPPVSDTVTLILCNEQTHLLIYALMYIYAVNKRILSRKWPPPDTNKVLQTFSPINQGWHAIIMYISSYSDQKLFYFVWQCRWHGFLVEFCLLLLHILYWSSKNKDPIQHKIFWFINWWTILIFILFVYYYHEKRLANKAIMLPSSQMLPLCLFSSASITIEEYTHFQLTWVHVCDWKSHKTEIWLKLLP